MNSLSQQTTPATTPTGVSHVTSHVCPVPTVPCSFALNTIKKRKVKFTIQINIQELLSVPYLNGVLFCKIRLCDGGNHVSYSSKKEVSNSSVIWSQDSPIQFDVKATQLYSMTPTSCHNLNHHHSTTPGSANVNTALVSGSSQQPFYVVGYESCLCRISVRKELRGGKSYQKLGYVDYNLADYIFKYQQETISSQSNEFCISRILKEYQSGSNSITKKNQQRLDNSYLKIKITIIDPSQPQQLVQQAPQAPSQVLANQLFHEPEAILGVKEPTDSAQLKLAEVKVASSEANSSQISANLPKLHVCSSSNSNSSATSSTSSSNSSNNDLKLEVKMDLLTEPNKNQQHMRNLSSGSNATTNSVLSNSLLNNSSTVNAIIHGHNRSCSNGSIKSNISFDFIIKNRNKKLVEDIQSTSSASSLINSTHGQITQQQQINQPANNDPNALSNSSSTQLMSLKTASCLNQSSSSSFTPLNLPGQCQMVCAPNVMSMSTTASSPSAASVPPSSTSKTEPANLRIIETRIDANEIISEIELELTNRLAKSNNS